MSRDYSNTGGGVAPSGGSNLTYLKLSYKTGKIINQTKSGEILEERSAWSGFLEGVKPRWNEGNAEHNIPAGWELKFIFSALDLTMDKSLPQEQRIKNYVLGFKLAAIGTGNILNQLLTALSDENWNQFIVFSFSKDKRENSEYHSLWVNWSNDGLRYKSWFAWDEPTKTKIGIPNAEPIKNSRGEAIGYDLYDIETFWLKAVATQIQPGLNLDFITKDEDFKDSTKALNDYKKALVKDHLPLLKGQPLPEWYKEFESTNPELEEGLAVESNSSAKTESSQPQEKKEAEKKAFSLESFKTSFTGGLATTKDDAIVPWWNNKIKPAIEKHLESSEATDFCEYVNALLKPKNYLVDNLLYTISVIEPEEDDLPF